MTARAKVALLRTAALEWLKFERRCALVFHERIPIYTSRRPDVIGVTNSMQLIEVEIKISVADFRADSKKDCRMERMAQFNGGTLKPHQFYYIVWPDIVDCVQSELPERAGLLSACLELPRCRVHRAASTNKPCLTLSASQWRRAVNQQSNAIVSMSRENFKLLANIQEPA